MNINENMLHQVAARFIKGKDIEIDIKGTALQLETLQNLLNVSKELMNELNSSTRNVEKVVEILTTHYIEEAEDLADRVGFINNGKISLIENKKQLTKKFQNITGIEWKL